MKFTLASLVALGAVGLASAQTENQTAAFALKTVSTDPEADGYYLGACHAGAAIEGLCTAQKDPSTLAPYNYFFLNYTESGAYEGHPTGELVWNLLVNIEGTLTNVSSPLTLGSGNPVSNIWVPLFSPGGSGTSGFGFDDNNELFLASYGDESNAAPGVRPPAEYTAFYHWNVCWTIVGGYYYQAAVWISAGAPVNPTCKPVKLVREWV